MCCPFIYNLLFLQLCVQVLCARISFPSRYCLSKFAIPVLVCPGFETRACCVHHKVMVASCRVSPEPEAHVPTSLKPAKTHSQTAAVSQS